MYKFENPDEYSEKLRDTLTKVVNKKPWDANDILEIKNVVQSINTHITYLIGAKFADNLGKDINSIESFKYNKMCNNGFDMEFAIEGKKIVAEIKGNIPVNSKSESYGANQKNGIEKDISYLTNGKKKNTDYTTAESLKEAYRFLILLENNKTPIQKLINSLVKNGKYKDKYFRIWEEPFDKHCLEKCELNTINIVFVSL